MSQQRAAVYTLVIDSGQVPATAAQMDALYRKVSWRLMPLFCTCIMLNYLDRTSLAFASIQMTQQLGFSPEVLGLGGGLFFLSYCLMQVPSNLVCMSVGVKHWLSCIMLFWGAVAAVFAAVQYRWQFYVLRLLLGLAEAGTFPAVWYGITLWFPPSRSFVPYALCNASVAVSQMLAAPVAAGLLRLDGSGGLAGWQWVFLMEGLPCVAVALLLPCLLPDRPSNMGKSTFLSQKEVLWLQQDRGAPSQSVQEHCSTRTPSLDLPVASPRGTSAQHSQHNHADADNSTDAAAAAGLSGAASADEGPKHNQQAAFSTAHLFLHVLKIWQIWFLACTEAVKGMSVMALMLWLPVMVQSLLSGGDPTQLVANMQDSSAHLHQQQQHHSSSSHSSNDSSSSSTGVLPVLLTAIPFTCAALLTTCLGALAQRTGRPLVYNFTPNLIGGAAFLAFPWAAHANRVAGFFLLTVALACGYASSPHPMAAITQLTARAMVNQDTCSSTTAGGGVAPPGHARATALALPMYNTVAMLGGFFGPWLLGVAVERFGGFSAGAMAMGVCMLAAGVCVLLLWCLHAPTAAAGLHSNVLCSKGTAGCPGGGPEAPQSGRVPSFTACGVHRAVRSVSSNGGRPAPRSAAHRKTPTGEAGGVAEAEQLLHHAEADAEGVSHDVEPAACREGSSPRLRVQRNKQVLQL